MGTSLRALIGGAALTGIVGLAGTTAVMSASPAPSTPVVAPTAAAQSPSADPLPEGLYVSGPIDRGLVERTLRAAGIDEGEIAASLELFPGGLIVFSFRLADGVLTQYQSVDGGPTEVGWTGQYAVLDDDSFVADDLGPITYDFTWRDGQLVIDVLEVQEPDPLGLLIQTAIYESTPFTPVEEPAEASPAAPSPAPSGPLPSVEGA